MIDKDELILDWKFKVYNETNFPYIVIDNFYNLPEEDAVSKELAYYSSLPNELVPSLFKDINVENIYSGDGRNHSTILKCINYKPGRLDFISEINKLGQFKNLFKSCNFEKSFVSYYGQDESYDEQYDNFHMTMMVWFFKQSKKFKGGDLKFTETNEVINCEHNRALLFPSFYNYQVTPIKFDVMQAGRDKLGKYCITHFFGHQ